MARAIQETIYDKWYYSNDDGVFKLNPKLYFIKKGSYIALEYMGWKILEKNKGVIKVNASNLNGKLFSSTDMNYIRAVYDFVLKKGKYLFEGVDITDELESKGYAEFEWNGYGVSLLAKAHGKFIKKQVKAKNNMLNDLIKASKSL